MSIPVPLIALGLGWLPCGYSPGLWVFLPLYLPIGLVAGPVIAIGAHHNPLLTLATPALLAGEIMLWPKVAEVHQVRRIFGLSNNAD